MGDSLQTLSVGVRNSGNSWDAAAGGLYAIGLRLEDASTAVVGGRQRRSAVG